MPWIAAEKCTGCGMCIRECPANAITMENQVARIGDDDCIRCGKCHDICPLEAVRHDDEKLPLLLQTNRQYVMRLLEHYELVDERARLLARLTRHFRSLSHLATQTVDWLNANTHALSAGGAVSMDRLQEAVVDSKTEGTPTTADIEKRLTEMTSTPEGRAILFLAPLAVVAWIDGKPDMNELVAIAGHHARERCGEELGCLSDEARQFFYFHFVYGRPSARLLGTCLTLLADALSVLPRSEAENVLTLLTAACSDVAQASGCGVLRKAACERGNAAIGDMLSYVRPRHASVATTLAQSLGFEDNGGESP